MAKLVRRQREQKGIIKSKIEFKDCKSCLKNHERILRSQQRFKSEVRNVFIEKVNKTSLSSNDDKRLHDGMRLDGITSYP